MDVVEMDGGLFAICPQDSEIDPVSLKKDDLSKYSFSTEKFLEKIRSANGLGGLLHKIYEDFFYLGCAPYKGNRVGFVFGFTIAHKSILELTGLKRLYVDDEFLVIFSPASVIEDVTHKRELYREKVVQTSFVSSLDFQTYEFSIKKILSESLKKLLLPAGTGQKIKSNETSTTPNDIVINFTLSKGKSRDLLMELIDKPILTKGGCYGVELDAEKHKGQPGDLKDALKRNGNKDAAAVIRTGRGKNKGYIVISKGFRLIRKK